MRIVCISDIHNYLPEIPDCDLLLIAGDLVHTMKNAYLTQEVFINGKFKKWIMNLSKRMKVSYTSGNHDSLFEIYKKRIDPEILQFYYEDSGFEFQGVNFWFTPWNKEFYNWSFNANEKKLKFYYDLIPSGTDVLISHQPPYGAGDLTDRGERVGSVSLMRRIQELSIGLNVVGHIHSDRGIHQLNDTTVINACIVDELYFLAYTPIVIDYEKGKKPEVLNI